MPRKKKVEEPKTFEQLLEEFESAQRALLEYFNSSVGSKTAGDDAEEEADAEEETDADEETENEAAESEGDEVEFPTAKQIAKLKKRQLNALAKQISLDTDGLDEDDLRGLLTTVAKIAEGDTEEIEDDEASALCKALSLTPKKKLAQNIEQLQKYFSEESEEEESEEEEEAETGEKDSDDDAEESEEADEEDESEEADEDEESEEEIDDGVDRAEIAKSADLPDMDTMKERLAAYNEAAGEDDQIEVETGKVKAAYRQLIERLIDSNGDIAEWGDPYVRNGEVCCCGLGLDEHKVKGEKGNFGKCTVTEKIFKVDDDGDATEYKPKKTKK